MDKLSVGDVVQLNSGGPLMTIKEYPIRILPSPNQSIESQRLDPTYAICEWFDENNNLRTKAFSIDMLSLYDQQNNNVI